MSVAVRALCSRPEIPVVFIENEYTNSVQREMCTLHSYYLLVSQTEDIQNVHYF